MATNVTERNKTLQEIIAWCDQLSTEIKCTEDATTDRTYGKLRGLYLVYEHCQHLLGYSGTMPSEVPNQKRGRGMSGGEMSDANPFGCQRDELTTMDMHTCDLCGRACSSPVYSVLLAYGGQAKAVTEVCADCMWRLKFRPTKVVPLEAYRDYERWVIEHPKEKQRTVTE